MSALVLQCRDKCSSRQMYSTRARSLYAQTPVHAPRALLAVRLNSDLCGGSGTLVAIVLVDKTSIALAVRFVCYVTLLFSIASVLMLAVSWRS
jgi:hypothetical protein